MLSLLNKGGPVMYPLLFCSWLALTIIFERVFYWYMFKRHQRKDIVESIFQLVESKNYGEALNVAKGIKDILVKTLIKGLDHMDFSLREALEMEIIRQEKKMNKGLIILSTIISVAPLLGILGTVTGIIYSFNVLGSGSIGAPKVVTEGIAQALLTTAFGLAIAIFTLIPYSYFQSCSENTVKEMEEYGTKLELSLKNK